MDVHLHGACMGKLVGPAGGAGGGGGGGGGISTQFRILPSSMPSESYPVDVDKVPVASHRAALNLRVSATTPPHRTFSPEPLKIGDEYLSSSGSNSPQLPEVPTRFLLHDVPTGVPSLTQFAPAFSPAKALEGFNDDIASESLEAESLLVIN